MGKYAKKTAFKKSKKEEKAKVKLKVSHRTLLPKGQNVTNTNFKVKKIVLKEQLTQKKDYEPISKNNLNIRELLGRINHHNVPFRCGALTALMQLIGTHGLHSLVNHLPSLLDSATKLILDKEFDIRSTTIKLLSLILSQISENELSPHFTTIIRYLSCAMSHIDIGIRESSLDVLDILISKHTKLTALHCQQIVLPAFLDLISAKSADVDERRLIMHCNKNMTSNIWRTKVFVRLQSLLQAILDNHYQTTAGGGSSTCNGGVRTITYDDESPNYVSLYYTYYLLNSNSELGTSVVNSCVQNRSTDMQVYTDTLVPLLLDVFTEIAPTTNIKHLRHGYVLYGESLILFKYISDIILLLWKIFSISDNPAYLKTWFIEKYGSVIIDKLISKKFPYSVRHEIAFAIKSPKRTHDKNQNDTTELPIESSCMEINILLCHMYLLLVPAKSNNQVKQKIGNYIIRVLKVCRSLHKSIVEKLFCCLEHMFASESVFHSKIVNLSSLITIIKEIYDNSISKDSNLNLCMFHYLTKICLNRKLVVLIKHTDLESWIDELPKLLTAKRIHIEKIKCMANIARCNIPIFIKSLDGYIEAILDNLPSVDIISTNKNDKMEGKKMIANMLYWVESWDDEFVSNLNCAIENDYFGCLKTHIQSIMDYKLSAIENNIIIQQIPDNHPPIR